MQVWKWMGRAAAAGAAGLALYAGVTLAGAQFNNNFHPIVPGEVYRSAQPSPSQIAAYAQTYGIRSIINLRGDGTGSEWYDAEVAQSGALKIEHFDFPMSARRELDANEITELTALMRDAPKPLLIHCKAGSDRTGLAASLYLAAVAGASEEASEAQLSLGFGHISIPFVGTWEMDQSFEAAEPSLGFFDS